LGHRKSINFDIFSKEEFSSFKIADELKKYFTVNQISVAEIKANILIIFLKKVQTAFFIITIH